MMSLVVRKRASAFSLIELVIVVVIIGIIAAIAIPRMSRGATGANESALTGNLAILRKAIDMYTAEHAGTPPTAAKFLEQLTQYTNVTGTVQSTTKTTTEIYGPYLRSIPPVTVGPEKGKTAVAATAAVGVAWVYDASTGKIWANTTTEIDDTGKLYKDY